MNTMEKRHSSPAPRDDSPRPRSHRKRSNSLPIVDALGCSTPEAELILAEGRAAVRSRQASARRRGRRMKEDVETFMPRDHLKYLMRDSVGSEDASEASLSPYDSKVYRHSRIPSNATDASTSTVVAAIQSSAADAPTTAVIASPIGDYSANLANFIKSQLNAIPSYRANHASISPSSCPDLTFHRSPPQSPSRSMRRPSDELHLIEMPPVRPPLKSAFSAWSSTDDGTDDDVPPIPDTEHLRQGPKPDHYTPSVLRYYENSNDSSFLFSSTPLEEEDQPDTAKASSFPNQAAFQSSPIEPYSPTNHDDDYPSSALSNRPQLTSSSAPSFSSTSTGSYFEYKRPITLAPHIRDRIIAAVTPPHGKVIPAISPFEGAALTNVHDVLVESQQRVLVDGMSFDMVRDFTIPDEGMRRVNTAC